MTDSFSVDNLRAFVEKVLAGEWCGAAGPLRLRIHSLTVTLTLTVILTLTLGEVEAKIKEEPDYSSTDYGAEGQWCAQYVLVCSFVFQLFTNVGTH